MSKATVLDLLAIANEAEIGIAVKVSSGLTETGRAKLYAAMREYPQYKNILITYSPLSPDTLFLIKKAPNEKPE